MKRILFIISGFCALTANAQDYLISFAATGASTSANSVKVENMTKGTTLTVNGSDILRLTSVTGLNPVEDRQSSEIKIYPNPMTDNLTMEISPPEAGNAVISVLDLTGKQVTKFQCYLENARQYFKLSGIKKGFYLINIRGNNYQFSRKLISDGESGGSINIVKINNNSQTVVEKTEKSESKGIQATVNMEYSAGDRLKFTGISGNYSTVKIDIPASSKTITFNFIACSDADNNNYPVVEIGTQIWMAENLKSTKYLNGDLIGTTTPATLNISLESTSKYQWAYNGIETNVATYGRLYTWFTVTDSRNVCPAGWHVPSTAEWSSLANWLSLNGYGFEGIPWKIAKSMTSASGWTASLNAGAPGNDPASNNSSGFTALPGGYRSDYGWSAGIGTMAYWWCSTENNGFADGSVISYDLQGFSGTSISEKSGFSVRCIKNN